jgi:hypothetical protein
MQAAVLTQTHYNGLAMSISLELKHLSDSLRGLLYDDLHKTLYATDASVYRILPTVALPKQGYCYIGAFC